MKKSFQFFFLCLIAVFSVTALAQDLEKVDPPEYGLAPYRYVAPLVPYSDDVLNAYPQNVPYWTGTCTASAKTDDSEVRGLNTEDGWFVFDVSGLPLGATINSVEFYGYVNATNWPYWSLTPMGTINPVTATGAEIKAYVEGNSGQGIAYVYSNESSSFAPGWHNYSLEPQAFTDLQNAIPQGWFACGMDSRDNSATYYINFDGWNQTNDPYLVIDYLVPTPHDVGTQSVDVPAVVGVGSFIPKATVFSQSTTNETFDVTMTITPGGYTSTKTVTNLPPAGTQQVTFDSWNAVVGDYVVEVCTQLGTDPNPANNCMTKNVSVQNVTPAAGYNAYDPTTTIPEGPVGFLLQTPTAMTLIAPTTSADFICAGTFDTWTQTWYGYMYLASNNPYYTIDPFTGAMVQIGSSGTSESIRGLAYDVSTDALYAVGADILYMVNKATGAATQIGPSGLSCSYIGLACSGSGQLYGIDMNSDNLIEINKTTGAGTQKGYLGFDVIYAQCADYDHNSDVLYWGAWNSGAGAGQLYAIDPLTSPITVDYIDLLGPGIEMDGMGVPAPPVPVELASFTANVNETSVTLNWVTATETNNHGFEIQRAKSESEFETVGFVEGNGTTTEMHSYSYTENGLSEGVYNYRLKQIDLDGTFEYSNAILVEVVIPDVYSLDQNYPNPFNPSTKIYFSLAVDSKVNLKVFDVLGQEVTTLYNNDLSAGVHNVTFNAVGLNSGVYFYRLEATGIDGSSFVDVKKMMLTK